MEQSHSTEKRHRAQILTQLRVNRGQLLDQEDEMWMVLRQTYPTLRKQGQARKPSPPWHVTPTVWRHAHDNTW